MNSPPVKKSAASHRPAIVAPFLPDICTLRAAFLLILLGELLALSLTLADTGIEDFSWEKLGLRSFLVQWIVLLSAALLCPLRGYLSRLNPAPAAALSFLLILAVTTLCTLVGRTLLASATNGMWSLLLSNLLIAAIFGGIVLRYLYVQQQWSNQQKAELQARLQALQARIHPHFLFNSMNSIASLISTSPQMAEQLVEDLCSLFRASLAEPGLVSLAEEFDLSRQYLEIERARLGERLQIDWQVEKSLEERAGGLQIPSLLLQPLLENAIQHGIQQRRAGGCIVINAGLESRFGAERVVLSVTNPLPEAAPPVGRADSNHMALDNIEHRLYGYFGEQMEFEYGERNQHFVARIGYPVRVTGGGILPQ